MSVDDIQIIIVYLVCCWYSHIDIDDLFTVNSELLPVAHEWENIGLALRLQPHVLSAIESNRTDVEGRLRNVLTKWLNKTYNSARFGDPTWQLLVAAVAHPAGGNNPALAQHITRTYNGKCDILHTCMYTVPLCSFTCLTNDKLLLPYNIPSPSIPLSLPLPFPFYTVYLCAFNVICLSSPC